MKKERKKTRRIFAIIAPLFFEREKGISFTKVKEASFLACIFACFLFPFAYAGDMPSVPNSDMWVTNGTVYAVQTDGSTTYIGGSFTYVGPRTGNGAPINISSGTVTSGYENINGVVRAVVSDGSGGWYIGGDFTRVGSFTRNRVAHILSDGSVDSSFNPNSGGAVYALAYDAGNSLLYIGGNFITMSGSTRNYIAAVNSSNGSLSSWNPNAGGAVLSLSLDSANSQIYVGGSFTTIGGQSRSRIAALSTSAGTATAWNPGANNSVNSIVVDSSNSLIYIGGDFTTAGGQTRNYIAALNSSDGTATSWNPASGSTVNSLALDSANSLIYVGGAFTTIGGQTRNRIAALSTADGTATAWNPNSGSAVYRVVLDSTNSLVYAGGNFTSIGGQTRNYVAALSTSSGSATSWNPSPVNTVRSLTLDLANSQIYVGGDFSTIGGSTRNNIAALNASTGSLTSWNPNAGSTVYVLTLDSANSLLYAGGDFTTIGGQTRNRIAALSTSAGTATAWNPNAGSTVYSLSLDRLNSLMYVGGNFTTIGGQTRNRIAALNTSDGTATAWDANAGGTVYAVALDTDNAVVYAGGAFTTIGGQTRNRLAALSPSGGTATAWNPNANSTVYVLLLDSNNTVLYVGGDFSTIGVQTRNKAVAFKTSDGSTNTWDPNINNTVRAFGLDPTNSILGVGGAYTSMGGSSQLYFASFVNTFTITASASAHGTITPLGDTVLNGGDDQSYTITPEAHYHVEDVLVDGVSVGAVSTYTFSNVSADHTISVSFSIDQQTLSYSAGAHGSISGDISQTIDYGTNGTAVEAVADSGYHFSDWSDSSTANPRTDTGVTDDISVTANFVIDADIIPPTVSITSPSDSGVVSGVVAFSADASDNISIEGVKFYSNSALIEDDTSYPYSVSLDTGLMSDGNYTLSAVARDTSGNYATSTSVLITVDSTSPNISSISVTASETTADISWTTDEPADSLIDFSPVSTFIASSTPDTNLVTTHSISLLELNSCTTYYYRVKSVDENNNVSFSPSSTFTTTGCTGNAEILDETNGAITSPGGSLSLLEAGTGVSLTVPSAFKSGVSTAYFQIKQLESLDFLAVVSTPPNVSLVSGYIYNLVSLPTATSSLTLFDNPLTVSIVYDDADVESLDESTFTIYRYDEGVWTLLSNCSAHEDTNTVTCETSHFSEFGLFGQAQSIDVTPGSSSGTISEGIHYGCKDSSALNYNFFSRHKQDLCKYANKEISQSKYSFNRDLELGMVGDDVLALQKVLNSLGFIVAHSGPGSPGNETNLFGSATKSALMRYQASMNIFPSRGYFGPMTRTRIQESAVQDVIQATLSTTPESSVETSIKLKSFSRDLSIGMTGEDVRMLQVFLNSNGYLVSLAGVGSQGHETNYFGENTKKALIRFQTASSITPALGYFGKVTRDFVNSK